MFNDGTLVGCVATRSVAAGRSSAYRPIADRFLGDPRLEDSWLATPRVMPGMYRRLLTANLRLTLSLPLNTSNLLRQFF
jgi:hypothetical protein